MVVKSLFHQNSLALFQYLDYWLGDAQSQSEAQARYNLLVKPCNHLGFLIKFNKSDLKPTQIFNFVSIHFNLQTGSASITQKNLTKVTSPATQMSQVQHAPARRWHSLIGTLQAQTTLIYLGRLKVRPIQFHLAQHWNQARDPPNQQVPQTSEIKESHLWWQNPENLIQDISLKPPAFTHHLFTNASIKGWGAFLQDTMCQGTWSQQESQLHINNLSLCHFCHVTCPCGIRQLHCCCIHQ